MIHIQEEKSSKLVRWYMTGSYEERSTYNAVYNLIHIDKDTVEIEGLCGNINRSFWTESYISIGALGYKKIKIERHGKWKTIHIKGDV